MATLNAWADVALHQVWSLMGLGEKDDVLPTGHSLALMYGTFLLNADVAVQKRTKQRATKYFSIGR